MTVVTGADSLMKVVEVADIAVVAVVDMPHAKPVYATPSRRVNATVDPAADSPMKEV